MADDDSESDASTNFISPRILFVRLRKDKSKDAIEDEIFKLVNKVLDESNDNGEVSEEAKNYIITLPDLSAGQILQVAVGPEFVGLLFDNGRVCRFKCVTKNLDSSKKLWNSQRSQDEPSFQVQSDEAYARQLQNQYLNNGATTSAAPRRSSAFGGPSISSSRSLSRTTFGSGTRTTQRFIPSSVPSSGMSESTTTEAQLGKFPGTSSSVGDNESRDSQANTSGQTRSSVIKTVGRNNGDHNEGNQSSSSTKSAAVSSEDQGNNKKNLKEQDSKTTHSQENSVENLAGNGTSLSSSHTSSARRSVSSPTLLQRTVFTTNFPVLRQFSAPFLFPSAGVSFPLYSNSTTGQMFGSRGSLRLEPRVVRAQLAEAGAFPRTPPTSSAQRCESRPVVTKCTSCCSDADFSYPEIGEMEWLEVENVSTVW